MKLLKLHNATQQELMRVLDNPQLYELDFSDLPHDLFERTLNIYRREGKLGVIKFFLSFYPQQAEPKQYTYSYTSPELELKKRRLELEEKKLELKQQKLDIHSQLRTIYNKLEQILLLLEELNNKINKGGQHGNNTNVQS